MNRWKCHIPLARVKSLLLLGVEFRYFGCDLPEPVGHVAIAIGARGLLGNMGIGEERDPMRIGFRGLSRSRSNDEHAGRG